MDKLRIEKEPIIDESCIKDVDTYINSLNDEINNLKENDKSIAFYKEKLSLMIKLELSKLRKARLKCIFNFQKKDDPGFVSLKKANDQLEKIDENISIINSLSFKIDISFFYTNSLDYKILRDMYIENYNIVCLINECSKFDFLSELVERLKKSSNNFTRNKNDIESLDKKDVVREIKDIEELNKNAVTKHLISKELFDLIKEYIVLLQPNNEYNLSLDDNVLKIYTNLFDPKDNNYYDIFLKLCDIEKTYGTLPDNYKNCIVNLDLQSIKDNYYKLYILNSIKTIIQSTITRQNEILKSLSKSALFTGYLKFLSECLYIIENLEQDFIKSFEDFDINSYLDLFKMFNELEQYNHEISSYKMKLADTSDDVLKFNYNNKVTLATIKIKNIVSRLKKNKYYKGNINSSLKSSNTEVAVYINIDAELRKQALEVKKSLEKLTEFDDLESLRNQYNNTSTGEQSFIEFLICNDYFNLAKLQVEKTKFLELLNTKYVQGDMSISFEDYVLNNNLINNKDVFTSSDIVEFEKSKVEENGAQKKKKKE